MTIAANPTRVSEMEVDFIYTFNPVFLTKIVLIGDAAFKSRVGELVLTHGAPEVAQEWTPKDNRLYEITIPVERQVDIVRLNLAAGRAAYYIGIQFHVDDKGTQLISRQEIRVEAKTFLGTTDIIDGLPPERCTVISGDWWQLTAGVWRHGGSYHWGTRTEVLRVPIPYTTDEGELELDIRWDLRSSVSSGYSAEMFVSSLNSTSTSSQSALFHRRTTSSTNTNAGTATVRIPFRALSPGISNFVQVVVTTYYAERQVVELNAIRIVRKNKNRITGGMAGTVTYRSGQSRKIHRIDLICNSNARARLLNDGFGWQEEDLGTETFWRGIHFLPKPGFITDYAFSFSGKDAEGKYIGDGVIHAAQFYEEDQQTEYDSPITVKFAVNINKNTQEGIHYYVDDDGREHCVAVNDVELTQAEYEHLRYDPAIRMMLYLPHEHGTVSGIVNGTVNIGCLDKPDDHDEMDDLDGDDDSTDLDDPDDTED